MKTLLLIDANALIHRSFHALPPFTNAEGMAVGALYGLASVLLKIAREEPPDYAAAAFDRPEPTFRKKIFKEYKAHRPPAPDDLISQIIEAYNLFQKFGIKTFEQPGLEADDLIGILSEKFKNEPDFKIVILTGDLDALQLVVGDKVVVKTLRKGISDTFIYNEAAVKERYDLFPNQLVDYKSLVGDQSDNIPGVPGIGPKTASRLINQFGDLDDIFEKAEKNIASITAAEKKLLDKLLIYKEQALLAKKLASIERQNGIDVKLEDLAYNKPLFEKLKHYFQKLGFQSLITRLEKEQKPNQPDILESAAMPDLFLSDGLAGFNLKERLKSGNAPGSGARLFDLGIAAWLIDPDLKDYSPSNLFKKFFPSEAAKKEIGEESAVVKLLTPVLSRKLKEYGLEKIFKEIEMPLIPVLADMENAGIKINKDALARLSVDVDREINILEEQIYKAAGERFNLNSPKQTVDVFNRRFNLKLSSTAAEKLENLKDDYPVVSLLLSYRENFKV
ncbi:MAG: DNA polymerase, partial [Patescibacteria group bacterium]